MLTVYGALASVSVPSTHVSLQPAVTDETESGDEWPAQDNGLTPVRADRSRGCPDTQARA